MHDGAWCMRVDMSFRPLRSGAFCVAFYRKSTLVILLLHEFRVLCAMNQIIDSRSSNRDNSCFSFLELFYIGFLIALSIFLGKTFSCYGTIIVKYFCLGQFSIRSEFLHLHMYVLSKYLNILVIE